MKSLRFQLFQPPRSAGSVAPSRWETLQVESSDTFPSPPPSEAMSDALAEWIEKIETAAANVYRINHLPVLQGHYLWSPDDRVWTFISDRLTPGERWEIVLSKPQGEGWRFATLAEIGREAASETVRTASELLTACQELKISLLHPDPAKLRQDIGRAIALGARWRDFEESSARKTGGSLQLQPPDPISKSQRTSRKGRRTS